MVGIIGAIDIEVAGLIEKMTGGEEISAGKITVVKGRIGKREVVVSRCGIGKVHAAAAAVFMLQRFPDIDLFINLGVAGGIKPGIRQGDFVVASGAVQHDFDATADGLEQGRVPGYETRELPCDKAAAEHMCTVLLKLGYRFNYGVIASGDQFINSKTKAQELYREFGAYACDMETAAAAHACDLFGVPFLGVRSISDNAEGGAVEDFYSFVLKAAERSINAVCEFLKP